MIKFFKNLKASNELKFAFIIFFILEIISSKHIFLKYISIISFFILQYFLVRSYFINTREIYRYLIFLFLDNIYFYTASFNLRYLAVYILLIAIFSYLGYKKQKIKGILECIEFFTVYSIIKIFLLLIMIFN